MIDMDYQEKMLAASINAARGIPVTIEGTGICLSCEEPVPVREGIIPRFCDKTCASDFEKYGKSNC